MSIKLCFFKNSYLFDEKRALVQITEKCNLRCSHCFVSATKLGKELSLYDIKNIAIDLFNKFSIKKITITGGEPLYHPDFLNITKLFSERFKSVTVCTNGYFLTEKISKELHAMGVELNISLDGFSENSHSLFRHHKGLLEKTKESIIIASKFHILKGILVTPNNLADEYEYNNLCKFAVNNNAKYILMNPLSCFGRGEQSIKKLAKTDEDMDRVYEITQKYKNDIELIYIRFPLSKLNLIEKCNYKNIIYLFSNGTITTCPYLIFACRTKLSKLQEKFFTFGSIFDKNICCKISNNCGFLLTRECPAVLISNGIDVKNIFI